MGSRAPSGMDPAELYDATAAYAWRLALCLHREPVAAERAVERAYRALFAELECLAPPPGGRSLHHDRTRLLAVLTEQCRGMAPPLPGTGRPSAHADTRQPAHATARHRREHP